MVIRTPKTSCLGLSMADFLHSKHTVHVSSSLAMIVASFSARIGQVLY